MYNAWFTVKGSLLKGLRKYFDYSFFLMSQFNNILVLRGKCAMKRRDKSNKSVPKSKASDTLVCFFVSHTDGLSVDMQNGAVALKTNPLGRNRLEK